MPQEQPVIIDIDEFHEAINESLTHLEHIDHAHGMLINMKLKLQGRQAPATIFLENLKYQCKRHWLTIAFIFVNILLLTLTLNK